MQKVASPQLSYYYRNREAVLAKIKKQRLENPEAIRAKERARCVPRPRPIKPSYLIRKYAHRTGKAILGPPRPLWMVVQYEACLSVVLLADAEKRRIRQRKAEHRGKLRRGVYRLKEHRRRTVVGKWTKADIDRLFLFQKAKCIVCRKKLAQYHIDHIMPIALGGTNHPENLQLLCADCNISKGAKHPVQFMQERGLLI